MRASATTTATRSRPAWPSASPRRTSRRDLLLPFYLRDRRVERVKNIQYAPRVRAGATSSTSGDPRGHVERAPVLFQIHGGGLGDRRQGQQALPAHAPPRGQRLGVRRRELPAEPAGRRSPSTSSTASSRCAGCASTSPSTAATPTSSSSPAARPAATSRRWSRSPRTTPRVPARLRVRRHVGHRVRARSTASTTSPRSFDPPTAPELAASGSATGWRAASWARPSTRTRALPAGVPDPPGAGRRSSVLRDPRRQRTTSCRSHQARRFVAALRAVSDKPVALRRDPRRLARLRGVPLGPHRATSSTESTGSSRGSTAPTRLGARCPGRARRRTRSDRLNAPGSAPTTPSDRRQPKP